MRTVLLTLVVLGLLAGPAATVGGFIPVTQTVQAQVPDIDVDINEADEAWYASPVWIAIGAIAVVVLVLLIVTATRGGGGAVAP